MLERVTQHPASRFMRCRTCGQEPRHVKVFGRSSAEPVIFVATPPRHVLECQCGAKTSKHPSLGAAEAQWGVDYAQMALPLRTQRRKRA